MDSARACVVPLACEGDLAVVFFEVAAVGLFGADAVLVPEVFALVVGFLAAAAFVPVVGFFAVDLAADVFAAGVFVPEFFFAAGFAAAELFAVGLAEVVFEDAGLAAVDLFCPDDAAVAGFFFGSGFGVLGAFAMLNLTYSPVAAVL